MKSFNSWHLFYYDSLQKSFDETSNYSKDFLKFIHKKFGG